MAGAVRVQRLAGPGHDFFFLEDGEASRGTILILHGFPDTPHSFAPLADRFAKQGYRVLRPFLPGYSPSQWKGPFDVRSISARILRFLACAETGPVHLVGHDWGAVLSYAMLHQSPESFLRSATMSVPHPMHLLRQTPSVDQLLKSSYMLFFQLPLLPEAWLYFPWQPLVRTLWKRWSPGLSPSTETIAVINQCLKDSGTAPFSYYRNLVLSLRPEAFGNVHVPLFYMHGGQDGCTRRELTEGQERYFKAGYREQVFRDAGHFLQLEATEEVSELLGDWFEHS